MTDRHVPLSFTINDRQVDVLADPGQPLVDVLRNELGETSVQVSCRNGDCGTCTVLIDGASIKSCMMPSGRADDRHVETLQGLASHDQLHPVQEAFWEANGFQCGYCLSGQVLCTVELLRTTAEPAETEIEAALQGNLCRCTGYQNILAAATRSVQLTNRGDVDEKTQPV